MSDTDTPFAEILDAFAESDFDEMSVTIGRERLTLVKDRDGRVRTMERCTEPLEPSAVL